MKKHFLIFSTLAFAAGLTAFGFIKDHELNNPIADNECKAVPLNDMACNTAIASTTPVANIFKPAEPVKFFYDFGPRFNPITKKALTKVKSVSDFIDQNEISRMDGVRSTALIILENEIQTDNETIGTSESLSAEQLEVINSLEYSMSFVLRVVFHSKDVQAESKGENIYYPHNTVVPEKQATYEEGKEAIIEYLRENNEKNIYNLDEKKLQPAKLSFTVAKTGLVEKVELNKSSGYEVIDAEMIHLISTLPGKWDPAENVKGEKVEQELVLSFGKVGC